MILHTAYNTINAYVHITPVHFNTPAVYDALRHARVRVRVHYELHTFVKKKKKTRHGNVVKKPGEGWGGGEEKKKTNKYKPNNDTAHTLCFGLSLK